MFMLLCGGILTQGNTSGGFAFVMCSEVLGLVWHKVYPGAALGLLVPSLGLEERNEPFTR